MRQRMKNPTLVEYYDKVEHDKLGKSFKYMAAKIAESNEALNDDLDEFVYEVKSRCRQLCETEIQNEEWRTIVHELADNETLLTKLTVKTAVETYYIGRIRYTYINRQLSSRNIYLEGSISHCQGEVVPLDLTLFTSKSDSTEESTQPQLTMSLFPGQIVVIKAHNPTGNFLRVTRFIELSEIFQAQFLPECPKVLLNQEPLNIVCASGPFVSFDTSKEIDFTDTTYMRSLADYLKRYNPDVLFIFGPFFDQSHDDAIAQWSLSETITKEGKIPCQMTVDKLFHYHFRALCQELEGLTIYTQICFIPSENELGYTNIFPTFPPEIKQILPIKTFWNPSLLNFGGIAIGAISTDVLLHISRHEVSK